jgi:hypothetical protein
MVSSCQHTSGRAVCPFSKTGPAARSHSCRMSTNNETFVWPILSYGDPSVVEYAEVRRPLGGGIMFGTRTR